MLSASEATKAQEPYIVNTAQSEVAYIPAAFSFALLAAEIAIYVVAQGVQVPLIANTALAIASVSLEPKSTSPAADAVVANVNVTQATVNASVFTIVEPVNVCVCNTLVDSYTFNP